MADYRNNGMTPDQMSAKMQRDLAQTQDNNINQLTSLATIQDKNGKKFFLGVEVPPEMVGTLQYFATVAPTYLNDWFRGGAYDGASSVFNKLNKELKISVDPKAGHKAGLGAAAVISGLLVGLQPASEIFVGFRERSKSRKDIRASLSQVIETSTGSYEHNEVIKTAMERTNEILTSGLKQAVGELPTVALNGYYAMGSHKELVKEKTGEVEKKRAIDTTPKGVSSKAEERARKDRELVKEREKFAKRLTAKDYTPQQINSAWEEQLRADRMAERDMERAKNQSTPEKKSNIDDKNKIMPILGIGILSSLFKHQISKGDEEDAKKTTAYNLIMELQEKVNSGHITENSNITDKIVEIFQQNEIDRGRSGIGPVLLEKLEPLAKRIGEVVAKKELDPLALVNLVGEGKVMNKRRFVEPDKLEELLDEQRKVFGGHEKTPLDEFLADFQSPKLIMAAMKENIRTLEGKDKSLYISMFSDEVNEAAGVPKKDIPGHRKVGHDAFVDFVKTQTVELAAKTPEELKSSGLSEKQIEGINSLNELISAGNEKEIKSVIDRGDSVIATIAHAGLEEQLTRGKGKGGKSYWTEVINKKAPVVIEKKPEASKAENIQSEREGNPQLGGYRLTYFHYYASTIRNLADVGKYAIYPCGLWSWFVDGKKTLSGDHLQTYAANYARIATALAYTGISSTFHAMESEMIDANSREAMATELGIPPDKVKFSDYGQSQNSLIKSAYHDSLKLQKYRYGTDLMFLLPVAISKVAPNLPNMTSTKHGLNEFDMLPFAGKAAYWAGETFSVEKSANYEIVKLRENLESTGKDMSANDLLGVYQRSRTDRKLPMIESKAETGYDPSANGKNGEGI